MILANDVTISGSVLLNSDSILDESSIDLLNSCNINDIVVKDDSVRAGDTIPSARPAAPENTTPPATEPVQPVPPEEDLPKITISVLPDATAASLVVEPTQDEMQPLDREMILSALHEKGVIHGIKGELIDNLIDQWQSLQRLYEIHALAEATPPVPGKEGDVRMTVRHLSTQQQCDQVQSVRYFWEVMDSLPAIDHVRPGNAIAAREVSSPSIPGKNVFGEPLFTDETIAYSVTFEKGARFDERHESVVAECEGIAWQVGSVIGVLPILFNGTYEVSVEPDEMNVLCKAHPAGPGGTMPGKEEILRQLDEHSVTFGINYKDIETLVKLCREGSCPIDPFIIAKGIPAVNGNDGTFDYHFDTETSLSPAIDTEGHADYKSVNIFCTVEEGNELVSLVSPTAGSRGTTVTGKIVPAKPGTPVKLPQGANTRISPDNPDILTAATGGIVRLTGGLVEVSEGYFVEGDVDFSTGNIKFNKTVIVNGDIKAGFNVQCGGDLQVNGTVEDSQLTVGGNVLCRFGFVGQGKGYIKAKGDVNIGFLKNQKVKSFKNIVIAKEAINCFLYSRESIHVHGSPLSIAGGEVTAGREIIAHTVGNHTGIRTMLQVGIDYLIVEELHMIDEQCSDSNEQLRKATESLGLFKKRLQGRKKLSSHEQKELSRLSQSIKQLQQQISVLEDRKGIVSAKQYHLEDAQIIIEHAAYPGTLFKFGDRHHLLKEELVGPKRIRYIEEDICILS